MNHLPVIPLTPEEQRRLSLELYARMESQVKSYHAHYGRNSTSIPTETARELMTSMIYTLEAAGGCTPGTDVSELLSRGQVILSRRLEQAKELLKLVEATGPALQTGFYGGTISALRRYLESYDPVHMAHIGPEGLDYPLLSPVPEQLRGIDAAGYILQCLWMEHQILDAFPAESLSELADAAPPDYWTAPQNLCEQPLWNSMALTLLGRSIGPLLLPEDGAVLLSGILRQMDREKLTVLFTEALDRVCAGLHIPQQPAQYARGAVSQLIPRLDAPRSCGILPVFFW